MTLTNGIATVNLAIRSVLVQLRVANGRLWYVIGQLWVRFGAACQASLTLWFVMHGIALAHRRIRYFLIPVGIATFAIAVGLKRVWVRSKPMWN